MADPWLSRSRAADARDRLRSADDVRRSIVDWRTERAEQHEHFVQSMRSRAEELHETHQRLDPKRQVLEKRKEVRGYPPMLAPFSACILCMMWRKAPHHSFQAARIHQMLLRGGAL